MWQTTAGTNDGVLFRPTGGRPRVDAATDVALLPQEVARIFRRRAMAAGLEKAGSISGHSARIVSANDLAEYGATSTQIQQAGRWKTDRIVTYYTHRSLAGSNVMANLRSTKNRIG